MNNNNIIEKDISLLPTLNVLTILTIIGSAFQVLTGFYNYLTVCSSMDKFDLMFDQYQELGLGEFFTGLMNSVSEAAIIQCDNRLLIFAVTILASGLCFFGAMQMRKLQVNGLYIYLVGEFALNVFTLIFFKGTGVFLVISLINLVIPIIFSILYLVQKKHLIL